MVRGRPSAPLRQTVDIAHSLIAPRAAGRGVPPFHGIKAPKTRPGVGGRRNRQPCRKTKRPTMVEYCVASKITWFDNENALIANRNITSTYCPPRKRSKRRKVQNPVSECNCRENRATHSKQNDDKPRDNHNTSRIKIRHSFDTAKNDKMMQKYSARHYAAHEPPAPGADIRPTPTSTPPDRRAPFRGETDHGTPGATCQVRSVHTGSAWRPPTAAPSPRRLGSLPSSALSPRGD